MYHQVRVKSDGSVFIQTLRDDEYVQWLRQPRVIATCITVEKAKEIAAAIDGGAELLSENQVVGTYGGWAVVRDLYETADGTRYSIRKSRDFLVDQEDRQLTGKELASKYPIL